jgi:hypothetical protein
MCRQEKLPDSPQEEIFCNAQHKKSLQRLPFFDGLTN